MAKKKRRIPIGYEFRKESKSVRRSFALMGSVLDALEEIAEERDVTVNALVNDVLLEYVEVETNGN